MFVHTAEQMTPLLLLFCHALCVLIFFLLNQLLGFLVDLLRSYNLLRLRLRLTKYQR
jgi:hypothetical protein